MKAMKGYFALTRLEIRHPDLGATEHAIHFLQLLMRQFQELVDQAEFMHDLQRRRMHGVAAKIPKEIGMLFQHHGFDSGTAEQISQHHAGRAAADNAATG